MMRRRTTTRRGLALLLAGAVAAAGCGGDDDDPGAAPSEDPESEATPLAAFLGWGQDGAEDGLSDHEREQERLVQDLVAACMRAQGFDYVPETSGAGSSGGPDGPFALPPAEFAAQYGYGVSTIDGEAVGGGRPDPNQAIVEALSPQAREAYEQALYGEAGGRPLPGWVEPIPGGAVEQPLEDGGCYQSAQDEVYGARDAAPDGLAAAFAELEPELVGLEDRIDRDARVQAAQAAWAACMADAGHPGFETPEDPPQLLRDQMRQLVGAEAGALAGAADPAELTELRALERALAQADLACRGPHDEVVREVRVELEEEFIEDHRDLLERYRDLASVAAAGG